MHGNSMTRPDSLTEKEMVDLARKITRWSPDYRDYYEGFSGQVNGTVRVEVLKNDYHRRYKIRVSSEKNVLGEEVNYCGVVRECYLEVERKYFENLKSVKNREVERVRSLIPNEVEEKSKGGVK